jgi:hypothetical protein
MKGGGIVIIGGQCVIGVFFLKHVHLLNGNHIILSFLVVDYFFADFILL